MLPQTCSGMFAKESARSSGDGGETPRLRPRRVGFRHRAWALVPLGGVGPDGPFVTTPLAPEVGPGTGGVS